MVGGLYAMGSSVVDSHTSPCLCLDALPSSSLRHKSGRDLVSQRTSSFGKQFFLSSSSVYSGNELKLLLKAKSSRKPKKTRRLVIVGNLGGQYEDSFEDVKAQILNYFTYKAVKTVLNQLYELNPQQYRWFYDFVVSNKPGDGKRFIRILNKEKQDLAERVMITRLHLYGKWVKKCDHAEMYQEISEQNLELMRERLMETVIWPSDDTNTEKIDG